MGNTTDPVLTEGITTLEITNEVCFTDQQVRHDPIAVGIGFQIGRNLLIVFDVIDLYPNIVHALVSTVHDSSAQGGEVCADAIGRERYLA